MSSLFAAVYPTLALAEEAQRAAEKFNENNLIDLVSSVVIVKGPDGKITQHHGKTPGAIGAGLGAVVGGLIGLVGGPLVLALGITSGALSGGWFDLLRAEQRDIFLNLVAQEISGNRAALLGEVVNASDEAKKLVEARLIELGGTFIGKDG